ncbi:hypothetical protein [Pontibacter liquoris]|uniref:hypothetical protein n=1 Tax=Pontibacter liquoris TaxID=2905677 RepID=UPI001FA7599E|nr:hypothetical protein [Pontibacter liquoris]
MMLKYKNIAFLLALLVLSVSCSTKNDLEAFKNAAYHLERIEAVRVNGIDLMAKKSPEDFSFSEAATLFSAFSQNTLKTTSTLALHVDLGEENQDRTMTITQLKWQLLVDDQQAASGIVQEPVELKNGLNTISVSSPVTFVEENGRADLNKLLQLATLLNQEEGKRPNVTLQIKPTIQTSVGPFELPAFINLKP